MEKKFSEMNSSEIAEMSDGDFRSVSPFEKKSCADCGHLKKALSLWCGNEVAISARGTRIPGVIKCPYWKPDWKHINSRYKTIENGYPKAKPKAKVKSEPKGIVQRLLNAIRF